ncbi:MAG TPA: hypothetical protein VIL85_06300 [Thermomicrobiales bacterium]|jgi:hypothetical protein
MHPSDDDRTFAEVAARFVAWRAGQPRPIERAWERAGFHVLVGPFDTPTLVVPTAAHGARGALPFACLPARAEQDAALRAAMLDEVGAQLGSRPAWAAYAERLRLALAIAEAE